MVWMTIPYLLDDCGIIIIIIIKLMSSEAYQNSNASF